MHIFHIYIKSTRSSDYPFSLYLIKGFCVLEPHFYSCVLKELDNLYIHVLKKMLVMSARTFGYYLFLNLHLEISVDTSVLIYHGLYFILKLLDTVFIGASPEISAYKSWRKSHVANERFVTISVLFRNLTGCTILLKNHPTQVWRQLFMNQL